MVGVFLLSEKGGEWSPPESPEKLLKNETRQMRFSFRMSS